MNRACPACSQSGAAALPLPHPKRCMVSNGRVLERPLAKLSCNACGYGFHRDAVTVADIAMFYDNDYDLGLRDRGADRARAMAYAERLLPILAERPVNSLIEFGCGTAALLGLLKDRLSLDRAEGLEASTQLATAAHDEHSGGISIRQGFAEEIHIEDADRADLCLSINVVEHALNPERFLTACSKAIKPDGRVVVVCPDGETPNTELMFVDHVSSFSVEAMILFAARAGLKLETTTALDADLDGFRLYVLAPGVPDAEPSAQSASSYTALSRKRSELMEAWQTCEARMAAGVGERDHAIFGIGEFADLLAAYAPASVEGAKAFVVDAPADDKFRDKPVLSTDAFLQAMDNTPLLCAVHERHWPALQKRLLATGIDLLHPYAGPSA